APARRPRQAADPDRPGQLLRDTPGLNVEACKMFGESHREGIGAARRVVPWHGPSMVSYVARDGSATWAVRTRHRAIEEGRGAVDVPDRRERDTSGANGPAMTIPLVLLRIVPSIGSR